MLKYRKKNPQKQGRILEGGREEFFWLARIYTPASTLKMQFLFSPYTGNIPFGYRVIIFFS